MKKNVIIYLLFFLSFLFVSVIKNAIEFDTIWEYGFSYQISLGFLPYKDINMIVGPLYNLLFAIPIYLFGNYLFVFEISHCLFFSFIFTCIYNKINKNSIYLFLWFSTFNVLFGYNPFCTALILYLLVIYYNNGKYSNLIIGLIVGTILMIKHNIGAFLLLAYLVNNRKKLLNTIYVFIPILLVFLYLLINNIMFEYIDYCFLGLGNFIDNFSTDFFSVIPLIISIIFLIKEYIRTKDSIIFYIFAYLIMSFPIFDQVHILQAITPTIFYYFTLNKKNNNSLLIKMFITIGFVVSVIILPILDCRLYLENNYLKYQMLPKDTSDYLKDYDNYLNNYKDKKIYLLLNNSYLIKFYRNEVVSKYDLLLKGNLGGNEKKYIEDMGKDCLDKECVFIVEKYYYKIDLLSQYIVDFKNYVVNNYNYLEKTPLGDSVYINY